jgi:hypothetical protein
MKTKSTIRTILAVIAAGTLTVALTACGDNQAATQAPAPAALATPTFFTSARTPAFVSYSGAFSLHIPMPGTATVKQSVVVNGQSVDLPDTTITRSYVMNSQRDYPVRANYADMKGMPSQTTITVQMPGGISEVHSYDLFVSGSSAE